jgi:hypothetical protein
VSSIRPEPFGPEPFGPELKAEGLKAEGLKAEGLMAEGSRTVRVGVRMSRSWWLDVKGIS